MAYEINKTDGSILLTVEDGTVDTDTTISFIGRQTMNFGDYMNENFLHMLENSSHNVAPTNPVTGQLWYNSDTNTLNLWSNANAWEPLNEQTNPFAGYVPEDFLHTSSNDTTIGDITILNDNGIYIGVNSDVADGHIYFDGDDLVIENRTENGDIRFEVNDGGTTVVPLLIDGATGLVSIIHDPVNNMDIVNKQYLDFQLGLLGNSLVALSDTEITGVVGGEVLTYNSAISKWENQAISVDNVSGFNITNPTQGQGLLYNAGSGEWENQLLLLNHLYDVNIVNPGSGDSVEYNTGSQKWERAGHKLNVSGGVITGAIQHGSDPINGNDLARKSYIDTLIAGLNVSVTDFPAGTALPFYNPSAPTGWTLDSSNNDSMMRIVSGLNNGSPSTTGGGTGGTDSPVNAHTHTSAPHYHTVPSHNHALGSHSHSVGSHSHSVQSHNHSVSSHSHSIPTHSHVMGWHKHNMSTHGHTTTNHTLTTGQMPSHGHGITNGRILMTPGINTWGNEVSSGGHQYGSAGTHRNEGNNQGHYHGVNVGGQPGTHNGGGTTNTSANTTGTTTNSTSGTTGNSNANTNSGGGGSTGSWSGATGTASGNTGTKSAVNSGSKTSSVSANFVPKYTNFVIGVKN